MTVHSTISLFPKGKTLKRGVKAESQGKNTLSQPVHQWKTQVVYHHCYCISILQQFINDINGTCWMNSLSHGINLWSDFSSENRCSGDWTTQQLNGETFNHLYPHKWHPWDIIYGQERTQCPTFTLPNKTTLNKYTCPRTTCVGTRKAGKIVRTKNVPLIVDLIPVVRFFIVMQIHYSS